MTRAPAIALLLGLMGALVAGCGSSSSSGGSSGDGPCSGDRCAPPAACPEGLAPDTATGACLDVIPADDCTPGTGAFLGSTSCQPIGWTACAPPFERDPSGWGCRPILAASCPANTMQVLGSTECRPIGDCAAPFPPANATMFVDASFTTSDATHFTSLFDAAQNANPGAVIAVAKGTYVEDVDVMRSNITIIGKCAAEVTIKNPGDRRAGILVLSGARGVKVRGLTLTGHFSGILVKGGSEATLEDSLIVKNRWQGVYVAEAGSRLRVARTHIDDVVLDDVGKFGWGAAAQIGGALELEDVVIDAPTSTGIVVGGAMSTGKLTRVVVHTPRVDKGFGSALGVVDGGVVDLDGASFDHLTAVGVMVSGGRLKARHMSVSGTDIGANNAGLGVQVSSAGQLDLAESQVMTSADSNILVIGQGSAATVASSLVRGALEGDGKRGYHGVAAAGGASLTLTSSALVANIETGLAIQDPGTNAVVDRVLVTDTRPALDPKGTEHLGVGVGVAWGATLTMTHGSIVKNHNAGFLVSDVDQASGAVPHADIASTLVWRTLPNATVRTGRGLQVSAGGTASLDGCAIVESAEMAALVGEGDGARLDIKNSVVRDSLLVDGKLFGDGIVVDGGGTLTLDGAWLLGHPGIAIAVSGGRATLARSLVARSAVALQVQNGSKLELADQVPADPTPLACVVSNDTRFVENQTRVGSGEVPLPTVLEDAPRRPSKVP